MTFHTFRNDFAAKRAGHGDDSVHDGTVRTVCQHVADKAAIDFETVQWQLAQIGEGGVAGTTKSSSEMFNPSARSALRT